MGNYHSLKVKPSDSKKECHEFKFVSKNATGITLRLSTDMMSTDKTFF